MVKHKDRSTSSGQCCSVQCCLLQTVSSPQITGGGVGRGGRHGQKRASYGEGTSSPTPQVKS